MSSLFTTKPKTFFPILCNSYSNKIKTQDRMFIELQVLFF